MSFRVGEVPARAGTLGMARRRVNSQPSPTFSCLPGQRSGRHLEARKALLPLMRKAHNSHMSDTITLERPNTVPRAPQRVAQRARSSGMAKERVRALLAQAEAAIAEGGRGRDITNTPADVLLARYRRMSRGV